MSSVIGGMWHSLRIHARRLLVRHQHPIVADTGTLAYPVDTLTSTVVLPTYWLFKAPLITLSGALKIGC